MDLKCLVKVRIRVGLSAILFFSLIVSAEEKLEPARPSNQLIQIYIQYGLKKATVTIEQKENDYSFSETANGNRSFDRKLTKEDFDFYLGQIKKLKDQNTDSCRRSRVQIRISDITSTAPTEINGCIYRADAASKNFDDIFLLIEAAKL